MYTGKIQIQLCGFITFNGECDGDGTGSNPPALMLFIQLYKFCLLIGSYSLLALLCVSLPLFLAFSFISLIRVCRHHDFVFLPKLIRWRWLWIQLWRAWVHQLLSTWVPFFHPFDNMAQSCNFHHFNASVCLFRPDQNPYHIRIAMSLILFVWISPHENGFLHSTRCNILRPHFNGFNKSQPATIDGVTGFFCAQNDECGWLTGTNAFTLYT